MVVIVKDKAQPQHGGPVWSQLWVQRSNPPRMPKHRESDHRLSQHRVQCGCMQRMGFMLASESRRKQIITHFLRLLNFLLKHCTG